VFRPRRGANLRELVKHGMPSLEAALKGFSRVGTYG